MVYVCRMKVIVNLLVLHVHVFDNILGFIRLPVVRKDPKILFILNLEPRNRI